MIHPTLITTPLRRILSTRTTLLALTIGPLLLFLLAGFAFENPQLQKIPIATHIAAKGAFASSFLATLDAHNFRSTVYPDLHACTESVRNGDTRACVSIDIDQHVTLHVDPTNTNIIAEIHNAFGYATEDYTTKAGLNYTSHLLEKLRAAKSQVDASRPIVTTFATQQEHVNRQLDSITGNLQTLAINLDESLPASVTKNLNQTNILAMYRSVNDLRSNVDSQFREATDNVSKQLDESAISEIDKQKIKQILSDAKENLRNAGDQFQVTSALTQQDLEAFKTSTDSLVHNIEEANNQLERLDTLKTEARKNIKTLQTEMNTNLLQLILMQNALNKISSIADDPLVGTATGAASAYNPLPTTIKPIVNVNAPRIQSTYPSLLALIIFLAGSVLSATLIILETTSPAQARNRMIPAGGLSRHIGIFLATLAILAVQTTVIFVFATFFIGIPSIGALLGGIATVFLISILAVSLGIAVAYTTRTEGGATLTCIIITLGLFLVSDAFVPLEALPIGLASAAAHNPYLIASLMLKRTLLFGTSLGTQWIGAATLAGYTLLCLVWARITSHKTI